MPVGDGKTVQTISTGGGKGGAFFLAPGGLGLRLGWGGGGASFLAPRWVSRWVLVGRWATELGSFGEGRKIP